MTSISVLLSFLFVSINHLNSVIAYMKVVLFHCHVWSACHWKLALNVKLCNMQVSHSHQQKELVNRPDINALDAQLNWSVFLLILIESQWMESVGELRVAFINKCLSLKYIEEPWLFLCMHDSFCLKSKTLEWSSWAQNGTKFLCLRISALRQGLMNAQSTVWRILVIVQLQWFLLKWSPSAFIFGPCVYWWTTFLTAVCVGWHPPT